MKLIYIFLIVVFTAIIYLGLFNNNIIENFDSCKKISPLDPENMSCDKGYFLRAIQKDGILCCMPPPPPPVLYGAGPTMPHYHPQ